MSRIASNGISTLLILSWTLLFLVIEPTHHHEDNQSLSDCPICMIAKQATSFAVHISLPPPIYTQYTELSLPQSRYLSTDPLQAKSRSPPQA